MKIIRDEKSRTIVLVPDQEGEQRVISSISETLKLGDKLSYLGRQPVDGGRDFCELSFGIGGEKDRSGRGGYPAYRGGSLVALRGTTDTDKLEILHIRNMCFLGPGLTLVGVTQVDGSTAVMVIGGYCKLCNARLINTHECAWRICDDCASKCAHEFIAGVICADVAGHGMSCNKCGRVDPNVEVEVFDGPVVLVAIGVRR
ncbi:MAG: hypothetical protein RLZZ347_850 [Candidatus Parcubacteria bacterium]|jgi:hypothetical protein